MQLPRRLLWLRSSLAVFVIALVASLAIHLPIYEVLGDLADVLLHAPEAEPSKPVEFELAPLADANAKPTDALKPEPTDDLEPDERAPEKQPPPKLRRPKPRVERAPEQKQAQLEPVVPVPVVPAPAQPPPPPRDNPLAVTQKSDDPTVAAPEDARFIADESRRVEQETVARTRNMHRDDPDPTASTRPTEAQDDLGNASEDEIADLQNVEGSEERRPNLTEAEHRPPRESQPSAGEREAQAVSSAAPGSPAPSSEVAPQQASGSPKTGGEPEVLVVQDGAGTFTIRKVPPGAGPGEQGGNRQPGTPSDQREQRAGSRAQVGSGANLRVKFSQFEATFGEDELRAQRETYLAQRRSSTRGGDRKKMWRKFRAAIENFVPNVQPGEQTALNTAASPFANYLAVVHRRIHREFAHRFIGSLPIAGGPFGDRALHAELEIVINGDGTLHQVGVTQTSGFLPFDYGAFNAVMRAGPYEPPPRKILSGDGRVYVHWGFYRNERQCGTFNARPFILPSPDGTPAPGQESPLQDQGESAPPNDAEPAIHDWRDGELGRIERGAPRARHAGDHGDH